MNGEASENTGAGRADELLRLICDEGEGAPASAALRELLARDDELRAHFEETRELVQELRSALQPQPLPDTLVQQIHARLDEQARPTLRGVVLRPLRLAGLAAALLLIVIGPLSNRAVPPQTAAVLSDDDAADIAAAYALLGWSEPLDSTIQQVASELENIDRRIEGGPGVESGLPWTAEDDWDKPPADRNTEALLAQPRRIAQNGSFVGAWL